METPTDSTAYPKILPADVFLPLNHPGGTAPARNNDFINLFAALIHQHGKRPVEFYALRMAVQPGTLAPAIQAMSGISALSWVDEYIRLTARDLLANTDLPLTEISQRLGFGSLAVFSQFFLRVEKIRPRFWRQRHRRG
ncbi:MAG: helix-turn-helix domain-containing protein [Verrucomicrobiales bacterium]|jgi:AraC-like DNA-binding protein|nr:helix-turn-helix domain-containing protein [Verrucomicrobiales bacterium]